MTYPRPATCHPERCVAMSPDVQIVHETAIDNLLIVECNACGTVVSIHHPDDRGDAEQAATGHITTHHVPSLGTPPQEGSTS